MCRALNYFELIFVSAASGCVSILAFASSVGAPVGIASSAVGLTREICVLTAGIKKIYVNHQQKRRQHDKVVFFWQKLS